MTCGSASLSCQIETPLGRIVPVSPEGKIRVWSTAPVVGDRNTIGQPGASSLMAREPAGTELFGARKNEICGVSVSGSVDPRLRIWKKYCTPAVIWTCAG